MTKNKFPKSVSFNLKNPTDQAILKHVKKRNFSGYVKKLILEDMRINNVQIIQVPQSAPSTLSKLEQLQRKMESSKNKINSSSNHNADT